MHAARAAQWAALRTCVRSCVRILAVSTTALALAGCAVGPKYVKPDEKLNVAWSEKADARLSTQAPPDSMWWHAFNDTTLDRLIQLGYHQNLPLEIAGLRIMEARAQ